MSRKGSRAGRRAQQASTTAITTIAANQPRNPIPELPEARVRAFPIGGIYLKAGESILISRSMQADAIVYGMSFEGRTQAGAIFVPRGAARVLVDTVAIRSLSQIMDRAIWSNVTFDNCKVIFQGDWFELDGVLFKNCTFEFSSSIPKGIQELVQSNGTEISVQFYPH